MKIVSITIETSLTKNLGNYQNVKASLALTIAMDLPFDSHAFEDNLYETLDTVNSEMEGQLRQQIIHAQRAIFKDEAGNDKEKDF